MSDDTPTVYEILAHRTREQIIDHWMEDKMFYQGQIRRLQGIIRELHTLHLSSFDLFKSAAADVVLYERPKT